MRILFDGTFGLVEGLLLLGFPAIAVIFPVILSVFYLVSDGVRSRIAYGAAVASLATIHFVVLKFGADSWVDVFLSSLGGWDLGVVLFLLAPRLGTLFVAFVPVLKRVRRWSQARRPAKAVRSR